MQIIHQESVGPYTIKLAASGSGYDGVLINGAKIAQRSSNPSRDVLLANLRNEAGKLHPNYHGMDEAISRFLSFFPQGFEDREYLADERGYKVEAQKRLRDSLPLHVALDATPEQAVVVRRAFAKTNVLHSTEFARAHQVLGDPTGPDYVRSAARFALGDLEAGLAGMAAALSPRGRASWPLLTYLPSLWAPDDHMFLKPEVTRDYAERVGHRFQFDYSADPDPSVYRSLLDLVAEAKQALAGLRPRDGTDVQSFIWTVGAYTDADRTKLESRRSSAQRG